MVRALVIAAIVAGCGRIGFEPTTGSGAAEDATREGMTNDDATSRDDADLVDDAGMCPMSMPACEACATNGATCSYADLCCSCEGGVWNCTMLNPASCPAVPPAAGSACTDPGLFCSYCPFEMRSCVSGQWTDVLAC